MTHPGNLDLIGVRVFDPIQFRLSHCGLIEWSFILGENRRFVGSQAQLPLQNSPEPPIRIIVEVLESFRGMMRW